MYFMLALEYIYIKYKHQPVLQDMTEYGHMTENCTVDTILLVGDTKNNDMVAVFIQRFCQSNVYSAVKLVSSIRLRHRVSV